MFFWISIYTHELFLCSLYNARKPLFPFSQWERLHVKCLSIYGVLKLADSFPSTGLEEPLPPIFGHPFLATQRKRNTFRFIPTPQKMDKERIEGEKKRIEIH